MLEVPDSRRLMIIWHSGLISGSMHLPVAPYTPKVDERGTSSYIHE